MASPFFNLKKDVHSPIYNYSGTSNILTNVGGRDVWIIKSMYNQAINTWMDYCMLLQMIMNLFRKVY